MVLAGQFFRRSEIEPRLRTVALVRRIWAQGAADRAVFIGLIGLTAAAVLASTPLVSEPLAAGLRGVARIGLFVTAWSVTLAAASRPLTLVLVSPWLIFFSQIAFGVWNATPIAVVPAAWLGWTFFRMSAGESSRTSRIVWWMIAAFGLGYVTAGPSGFRKLLDLAHPEAPHVLRAQLVLGALLAAAGTVALHRTRGRPRPVRSFVFTLSGAVVCIGFAAAASVMEHPNATIESIGEVFSVAASVVVLFWLWTAGSFAGASLKLTEWTIGRIAERLPRRAVRFGIPAVLAAATLAEWVAIRGPGPLSLGMIGALGHFWVGLASLTLMASWRLLGRLSTSRLIEILIWWIIAWIVCQGFANASDAVVASTSGSLQGLSLAIVSLGLIFELAAMKSNWLNASTDQIRTHLGLVVIVVACAAALATVPGSQWPETRSLMVLYGMIHLGVPVAIYARWQQLCRPTSPLPVVTRVAVFAAGYLTALVALAVEPQHPVSLLLSVPFLLCTLVVVRGPSLRRADGMLAGALFGAGLVSCWMWPHPPILPPFIARTWQQGLPDFQTFSHQPLTTAHAGLVLGVWLLGAGLGWLVFRIMSAADAGQVRRAD